MIIIEIFCTIWGIVFLAGAVIWLREANKAHQEMKKEMRGEK
jgi:hypothetical protein